MKKFEKALVITHFMSRKSAPYDPIEGPANSVCNVLSEHFQSIGFLQLPLFGFDRPIFRGHFHNPKETKIPAFLGRIAPIKYLIDSLLISYCIIHYCFVNKGKKKLIVAVDPLSCLPLVFFKIFFEYTLVFYSVDFNQKRFSSGILQKIYEWANKVSSQKSDQTWVVSESLQKYQKEVYGVEALHISNAPVFDGKLFQENRHLKTGNKLAWSGSFMTERQFDIFFTALKSFQSARKDLEIFLVPIADHEQFEIYGKKYELENFQVLRMYSRAEWQSFVVTCDIGIAIYDDQFGQTHFAEPLKIWDYLMTGVPFIISKEPSMPLPVRESGVAFVLDAHNKIPEGPSLASFLEAENLKRLQPICVNLAEQFSIKKTVWAALEKLT